MLSSPLFRYSANGPNPNLNTTMGMILIGLILDTMLYGIVFFQTYLYFTSGARDCTSLRALVVVLWTLDTLQLALLCHAAYYFLVLCNGHPDDLARSVWSLNLEIAPSVIATFMVPHLHHYGVRASAARHWSGHVCYLIPSRKVQRVA